MSKDYPSHVKFETSIGFIIILNLIFQISDQGKSFKKLTIGVLLFRNIKLGTFI